MDIVYRRGQATAMEVQGDMADPPSYSAVRATMGVLEKKGHLEHFAAGSRYVYRPTVARDKARSTALKHVVETFFDGSAESVVAALLQSREVAISPEELDRLSAMILEARKEGR